MNSSIKERKDVLVENKKGDTTNKKKGYPYLCR